MARRMILSAAAVALVAGIVSFPSAAYAASLRGRTVSEGCVYFVTALDNSDESQGIIRSDSKNPADTHRAFTNTLAFGDFQRGTNWATWSMIVGFQVPDFSSFDVVSTNLVLHERLSRGVNPLVSPGGWCNEAPCLRIDTANQFGPEVELVKDDLDAPAVHEDVQNGEPWAKLRPDGVRRYYVPLKTDNVMFGERTMVRMRNFGRENWNGNGARDLVRFYDWHYDDTEEFMPRLEITTSQACVDSAVSV